MPKNIKVDVMTPQEFATNTGCLKFTLKGKSHPLFRIYNMLLQYHNLKRGSNDTWDKARWKQQHDLLIEIAGKCEEYAGPNTSELPSTDKMRCVKHLGSLCALRALLESNRATELAQRMTTPAQGPYVGRVLPHLVFERLNKVGIGRAMHGDNLRDLARKIGVELTGDPNIDYYAMKKILKVVRTEEAQKLNIVYASGELRDQFRIYFMGEAVYGSDRQVLNTRFALYACSKGGAFYAADPRAVRNETGLQLQHSSFLAGADPICAGTIGVEEGRLQFISNNSGHYGPDRDDLLAVCQLIVNDGYDPKDDGFAVYDDFQHRYGTQTQTLQYKLPIKMFIETQGNVPNPEDFVCGAETYTYPARAAARGVKLNAKERLKTGFLGRRLRDE